MIFDQSHDTSLGDKQSLFEVRTNNVSPKERYEPVMIAQTDEQCVFYLPPPEKNFVGWDIIM